MSLGAFLLGMLLSGSEFQHGIDAGHGEAWRRLLCEPNGSKTIVVAAAALWASMNFVSGFLSTPFPL